MIDIDCFKNYNDHYGHLKGDEVLKKVASLLAERAGRATDLVARYGGEEFIAIRRVSWKGQIRPYIRLRRKDEIVTAFLNSKLQ
jgi:diguanylate cyclase (GGDEF)-like protein